jgi:hypothetical protein
MIKARERWVQGAAASPQKLVFSLGVGRGLGTAVLFNFASKINRLIGGITEILAVAQQGFKADKLYPSSLLTHEFSDVALGKR